MKSCYKVSNITSNDSVSLKIEAKTCSTRKKEMKDNMGLKYPT